jgi:hypothetical protein
MRRLVLGFSSLGLCSWLSKQEFGFKLCLFVFCACGSALKVIAKSIALLNPADVLKLLQSLVSIIQLR